MSFWTKVKTTVKDLTVFKNACEKHGVDYQEVTGQEHWGFEVKAVLQDRQGSHSAYLVHDGGAFKLMIDNDSGYSSLTKRLGQNGGRMMRDYTMGVVEKQIRNSGGTITYRQEQPDGSVILKMAQAA